MRRVPEVLLPTSVAVLLASYWATCSLLIHYSFHSNAWDLGIITQVIWNTGRGEPFEYSFRAISYAGDHWQPGLLLFVPLVGLGAGAGSLLVSQAALLGAAVFPLYYAVRRTHDAVTALLICISYGLNLGVARAVSFDFHMEAMAPVLAFAAILGFVARRGWLFTGSALFLLTVKEDAALLVLGLACVSFVYYGERSRALAVGSVAIAYAAIVNLWLVPHYRGSDLNPLRERYGYLGDTVPEILLGIVTHPGAVLDHLVAWHSAETMAMLVLFSGGALVLRPALGLAVLPLTLLPLLSNDHSQSRFELHYLLVPAAFATCAFVVHMDVPARVAPPRWLRPRSSASVLAACSALLFVLFSPLPPSFSADSRRFDIDDHAWLAREFIGDVPTDVTVSAQSPFVPHLATRAEIFDFPRVLTAEYVLTDQYGPKPADDLAAGYDACFAALPRLGFDVVREEDGIQLWRKVRAAEAVPDVPVSCSGQRPG